MRKYQNSEKISKKFGNNVKMHCRGPHLFLKSPLFHQNLDSWTKKKGIQGLSSTIRGKERVSQFLLAGPDGGTSNIKCGQNTGNSDGPIQTSEHLFGC